MAMTINLLPEDNPRPAVAYITAQRLCVDATRERVVSCDSPDAAYLLAGAGTEVTAVDAARYGLPASATATATAKQISGPPEDKALKIPRKR